MDEKFQKITFSSDGWTPLPNGRYKACLLSVDVVNRDELNPRLVFVMRYRVTEGEFKDCSINDMVNVPVNLNCNNMRHKLRKIVIALTKVQPGDIPDFRMDYLIGKECIILVELKENNGRTVNRICQWEPLNG